MLHPLFQALILCSLILNTPYAKDAHSNPSLGFEISPSQGQRILLEKEWLSLNQSAVSGTVSTDGRFVSLLLLESYPGLTLSNYVQMVLQELPAENTEMLYYEETTQQNRPCIIFGFKGTVQDQPVQYHIRVFAVGTAFFQQVGYYYLDSISQSAPGLMEMLPELSLTPGVLPALPDHWKRPPFGSTWYASDSEYVQAALGFRMKLSKKDLELIPEELLSDFHPGASAAFRVPERNDVIFILGFLQPVSESEAMTAFLEPLGLSEQFSNSKKEFLKENLRWRPRFMQQGKRSLLFVEQSTQKDSRLDYILARGFSWLTAAEMPAVVRELKQPGRQILLLDDWQSFHHNTYRNNHFGITLTFASDDLIEARLIPAALEGGGSFEAHNHSREYSLMLEIEEDLLITPSDFHSQSLELVAMSPTAAATLINGFLVSSAPIPPRSTPSWLCTLTKDATFLRLIVHTKNADEVGAILGRVVIGPLKDIVKADAELTDQRLGYRVRGEAIGSKSRIITSANLKPIGELIQFEQKTGTSYLMAVNAPLLNSELALQLFLEENSTNLHPEPIGSETLSKFGLSGEKNRFRVLFLGKEHHMVQETLRRGTLLLSAFTLTPIKAGLASSGFFETFTLLPELLPEVRK